MFSFLYAFVGTSVASDVVLPAFSVESMSDFQVADVINSSMQRTLEAAGISVDGPSRLVAQHPDLAVGCSETPGCPVALMARMDGNLAVVGHVSVNGEEWDVTVRFFSPGDLQPVRSVHRTTGSLTLQMFSD